MDTWEMMVLWGRSQLEWFAAAQAAGKLEHSYLGRLTKRKLKYAKPLEWVERPEPNFSTP
ncbi:hypothetical protein KMZ15_08020 [Mycoavidus sp. HKI]|uniref:hypothetical protein n=1 Tax=Mycoavidus sp. HKI TaxID=2840467 RepID=UPI001CBC0F7F|nr:hypothetical protein [Mycoavidus sp. HKI]UAW63983.1 hypothetical protein KMZ15_08020 [Mycoavidus sp. HKI]